MVSQKNTEIRDAFLLLINGLWALAKAIVRELNKEMREDRRKLDGGPAIVSATQACEIIGISRSTWYKDDYEKLFAIKKHKGEKKFLRSEIIAYIESLPDWKD